MLPRRRLVVGRRARRGAWRPTTRFRARRRRARAARPAVALAAARGARPSRVYDHARLPLDGRGWPASRWPGSVVYELHIGTFTPRARSTPRSTRLDHLVDLGVDIVELMPVAAFPGSTAGGTTACTSCAVHEPYGGPDGFKRLVDACHARGLGGGASTSSTTISGRAATTCLASARTSPTATTTPWGEAVNLDDDGCAEVRRCIIDNALMWLRDYHVDGLRLDAVHALVDDSRRAPARRAVATRSTRSPRSSAGR